MNYTASASSNKRINSKIVQDEWLPMPTDSGSFGTSGILMSTVVTEEISAEGLNIYRYKTLDHAVNSDNSFPLDNEQGHIFSLLKGGAKLILQSEPSPLDLTHSTHLYIPPGECPQLVLSPGSYAIHLSGARQYANGTRVLIRNERFAGAARNVLTPQYLSRRMFTNRDKTLCSKYGTQVAWFHTTMFDSIGLGTNHEGKSVFKMSYDNQTEPNVVYEVGGVSQVRFALHPYAPDAHPEQQAWSDWQPIDGETMYYLNEASDGKEVETVVDEATGKTKTLRNRHEVFIAPKAAPGYGPESSSSATATAGDEQGYVSLCCLFDPGPTGLEEHLPGKYSSYAPVSETLHTPEYEMFVQKMARVDNMIDVLSLADARGADDDTLKTLAEWSIYEEERKRQLEKQAALLSQLSQEGKGRENIVGAWRLR